MLLQIILPNLHMCFATTHVVHNLNWPYGLLEKFMRYVVWSYLYMSSSSATQSIGKSSLIWSYNLTHSQFFSTFCMFSGSRRVCRPAWVCGRWDPAFACVQIWYSNVTYTICQNVILNTLIIFYESARLFYSVRGGAATSLSVFNCQTSLPCQCSCTKSYPSEKNNHFRNQSNL